MRYELTPEELLVIKQDQIDRDLRVKVQLEEEIKSAYPEDDEHAPRAGRVDGVQVRIDLVQQRLDQTIEEAKALEKKVK